ncbi:hypothetical protein N7532_011477 [Penicillium argentinense]|uniref:Uncharacterized protein n=1 Tax=Penicillium argentinense TaxID=1131581 RepID=A0A9W9EIM4_9EURO|nr:uncharacterized protein N7532_011477 [Penicillium argentinense]KAJ5082434.1 hypothetical protein N7532_011477 [Penicillium argentinense]
MAEQMSQEREAYREAQKSVNKAQNPNNVTSSGTGKVLWSKSGPYIARNATFELATSGPRVVAFTVTCVWGDGPCREMLPNFDNEIPDMMRSIIKYLIAPMAAHYPDVVTYPLVTFVDVDVGGYSMIHESGLSDIMSMGTEGENDHRKITIKLPHRGIVWTSVSPRTLWREALATFTYEVALIFQCYRPKSGLDLDLLQHSSGFWDFWLLGKTEGVPRLPVPLSAPKGLLEGISDYVVVKSGLERLNWQRPSSPDQLPQNPDWGNTKYQTAYFLEWLENSLDKDTVPKLMGQIWHAGYADDGAKECDGAYGCSFGTWETVTGMKVEDLWQEYVRTLDAPWKREGTVRWTWAQLYFVIFVITESVYIMQLYNLRWFSWLYSKFGGIL